MKVTYDVVLFCMFLHHMVLICWALFRERERERERERLGHLIFKINSMHVLFKEIDLDKYNCHVIVPLSQNRPS